MAVWLYGFPLPPSVNSYLMPVRGRLVKTKEHRKYQDLCYLWAAKNRSSFDLVKEHLNIVKLKMEQEWGHSAFRVDCFVAFERSRVFTINNKLETLDANNRLKPLLDGLVSVLGIDDKTFFAGNCEKVTTTSKETECALLRIAPMKPRTLREIKREMNLEMGIAGF